MNKCLERHPFEGKVCTEESGHLVYRSHRDVTTGTTWGTEVTLLDGPYKRIKPLVLSYAPERIVVGNYTYVQVSDPDTGTGLGGYVLDR